MSGVLILEVNPNRRLLWYRGVGQVNGDNALFNGARRSFVIRDILRIAIDISIQAFSIESPRIESDGTLVVTNERCALRQEKMKT